MLAARQEVIVLVMCWDVVEEDGKKHETAMSYLLYAQQKRGTAFPNKKRCCRP